MTGDESQIQRDDEHLRLLRIGYLIAGGANALFALFPLIYVGIGVALAIGLPVTPKGEDPRIIGWIMAGLGLCFTGMLGTLAVLKLLAARALRERRRRTLCLVTAALSCLSMPYGTALGVLTFIVLDRDSVRRRFEPARSAGPVSI
jgi:hypothetical protein